MPGDEEDSRHKREQAELKAKRKASKISQSRLEKERKGKEYRQEILRKQGHSSGSANSSKRSRKSVSAGKEASSSSTFQKLFAERAQGFQITFAFRNAPPRPPVGPCFVGNSLNAALLDESIRYKPMNAIEMNHTWKLHSEEDIGVPLAPTAMDPDLYNAKDDEDVAKLHPDDEALLSWKGHMGDSSQDIRKRKQEMARAVAIQVATGRSPASAKIRPTGSTKKKQKSDSRVLKEDMPKWQKKTTYLANDHTRKVHDFRSLAETKKEMVVDMEQKRRHISARRSASAIRKSFDSTKLQHPTRKNLKPVKVLPVLPNAPHWGHSFTHVVIDKVPTSLTPGYSSADLVKGLVTNVEVIDGSQRMACDVQVPVKEGETTDGKTYRPLVSFDLAVEPLKDEEGPHTSFCFCLGTDTVQYIPVPSRVKLSTGRPSETDTPHPLERRPLTEEEQQEVEERAAEVDETLAAKFNLNAKKATSTANDDGEDDYDDSDSDEDGGFIPVSAAAKPVEAAT